MSLILRLTTLFIIAAAGFALPMTCAQNGAAAAGRTAIEIPVSPHLESPARALADHAAQQTSAHELAERALESFPFDCGKTAPRVTDHPANFDTQPFVPGYLTSDLLLTEDRADTFALPVPLRPVESRAGPPDAPPPKSIA